ncbi:trypsin-like [Palaemon carinicauda]|uniref:trypsin-like n=1 Tax=Palaemon carinicauda TaxID=392227 RepID=UPI0035B610F7
MRSTTALLAYVVTCSFFISSVQGAILWNKLFGPAVGEGAKRCACSCGMTNRRMRVVGGNNAEFNEYPWMVALLYKGHFYCGGTLISDRYVLTAAHCIEGVRVNNLKIIVGDHIRSFPIETNSKEYQAVYSVYHHEFNRSSYNNDIGLIKLGQKVDYKWYSRPACLPRPDTDYVGEMGVVSGWGRESEKGDPTDTLREILVPIFSNPVCQNLRYKPYEITHNMLCAGYLNGGTDSCHGDSGGGLLWQGRDGKMDVIGVVSWGQGCARRGYPGIYTRVTNYLNWIEEHTKDSCFCGRREGRS